MSTTTAPPTAPHFNVYVTVVDKLAHRLGPWIEVNGRNQELPSTAACKPAVTGPSLSFGRANELGCTPCTAVECWPPPGSEPDRLWVATRRRGLNHHRLPHGETKTGCGRYAGQEAAGEYDNGLTLTAAEVAQLDSKRCPQCWTEG